MAEVMQQEMEQRLVDTIAEITGRLVARPDATGVLGLVSRGCSELLDATAIGVLVADPRGELSVVAASAEGPQFVELLASQSEQGPCADCIRTGTVVVAPDLRREKRRWPTFVPAALEAGYRAVHAIPLRLGSEVVGGLNLLYRVVTRLPSGRRRLAQALADLATLGLSQERDVCRDERFAEANLTTLNDRLHLAQAIGMVAAILLVGPDEARAALAAYARRQGRPLREVAQAVTDRTLDPAELIVPAPEA